MKQTIYLRKNHECLWLIIAANTVTSPRIINDLAWQLTMTKILNDEQGIGRAEAIAALQLRIRTCRLCQQHGYIREAHPIVSGRATDRILVIGQAPGHRSIAKDLPFSGPGGRILQKWLEQAGFPPGYLHEH